MPDLATHGLFNRLGARLKGWAAPPVFLGDETRTRRAALLNIIIVIPILMLPFIIISNLIGGNTPPHLA